MGTIRSDLHNLNFVARGLLSTPPFHKIVTHGRSSIGLGSAELHQQRLDGLAYTHASSAGRYGTERHSRTEIEGKWGRSGHQRAWIRESFRTKPHDVASTDTHEVRRAWKEALDHKLKPLRRGGVGYSWRVEKGRSAKFRAESRRKQWVGIEGQRGRRRRQRRRRRRIERR